MTVISVESLVLNFGDFPRLQTTLDAWNGWRQDRAAPSWRDVDLYNIPLPILPNTLVVDVIDGGRDYRYRFWGTGMTKLFGVDKTSMLMTEAAGSKYVDATFKQLSEVLQNQKPRFFKVIFHKPNEVAATKFNLRLPVMDNSAEVTKIITVSEVLAGGDQRNTPLEEIFTGRKSAYP